MKNKSIFITGIDTDAGKTYATGWLAKKMMSEGKRVITQKFIQTGNVGRSEDIEQHRRIMGCGMLEEDRMGLTAPQIFPYPASAQLAARLSEREVDLEAIDRARIELEKRYDVVLVEGAGGLMVPITDEFLTIDYLTSRKLPAMLVTSSRLGSINHTLLSMEAMQRRGINVIGLIYNTFHDSDSREIAEDTRQYLKRHFGELPMYEIPVMRDEDGECRVY